MMAISLWQPWASLWCNGVKVHETRNWATAHRGWLMVHAAKRPISPVTNYYLEYITIDRLGKKWKQTVPLGALIGMVRVVDCKPTEEMRPGFERTDDYVCGNFEPGRYAWKAEAFKTFKKPIAYRGKQGLFNVPDDIIPRS